MMKEEEIPAPLEIPGCYRNVTIAARPTTFAENPDSVFEEDSAGTHAPFSEDGLPEGEQIPPVSFPPLSDGEIKRACHFYVAEKWCYGSKFIENMTMTEVSHRIAYQYTLESFSEKRETAEQITPYYGEPVDGPECGPTLAPWSIPVEPPQDFQSNKIVVLVPHTSYIKDCPKCNAIGHSTCKWCFGIGGKGCILCLTNKDRRPCNSCFYSNRRCIFCNGHGTQKCRTCDGQGKLRAYQILIVTWTNHSDNFITDTLALPREKIIDKADGKEIFVEEAVQLSPVWNIPNASVVNASSELIRSHPSKFKNELIRKQRHTVRAIPFTQVQYHWREQTGEFYVYGLQKKAYFYNYPQEFFSCCNVM